MHLRRDFAPITVSTEERQKDIRRLIDVCTWLSVHGKIPYQQAMRCTESELGLILKSEVFKGVEQEKEALFKSMVGLANRLDTLIKKPY